MDFDGIDWEAVPGPASYIPSRVPQALRKISTAERGDLIYDGDISFAVDNDHNGRMGILANKRLGRALFADA